MIGTRREHPHGTVTDIFKFERASLLVMGIGHGDEQPFTVLRVGAFVVNLYVQAITHIMMTTCAVGDLKWPLSRDSMVVRVGERSFAFVMLGLLYGLQLPLVCDEDTVDTLERVFMKFCDYTTLEYGENGPEHDPSFWAAVRPFIEGIARVKLGNNWRLMEGNPAASLSKVLRTSATTKTMSNAIVTGFLKPTHVDNYVVRIEDRHKRYTNFEEAFSSISAITDIVNSLETIWEVTAGNQQALEEADKEDGSAKTSWIKLWKLNQHGLAFFLRQKLRLLC
ncbi:hypothetical protein BT93_L0167 [Corymbia citriodora subsp. variegata]|uniref:Uncharacterized protein n=1 Tax=Corymbia citriodora subsp. variegata TaxID=360336 RepID=A0A8T0CQF6_CORYI|nr:hypothetical protein BT93_L0167 [Corymbia citriodora subsp. variegata]